MSAPLRNWPSPIAYMTALRPEAPVHFFAPRVLAGQLEVFKAFPGVVTFAVKANPDQRVLMQMINAGIGGFDVASIAEIRAIREISQNIPLHYNNPVRSRAEIAEAVSFGVRSFAVDSLVELEKLPTIAGLEVSVRLKLPEIGARYDFGRKFGVSPDKAVEMLKRVVERGFLPAMTFHVGTQCESAQPYRTYIRAAAEIAKNAGVQLRRLNVGGGFPAQVPGFTPDYGAYFTAIEETVAEAFGGKRPALVCEPGRALVAGSFALGLRVKSVREDGSVFLNDGLYGGLSEFLAMTLDRSVHVYAPTGEKRRGPVKQRVVFGPTCDSVDEIPGGLRLPLDITEGDFVIFHDMGAYVTGVTTRFNGYGAIAAATVAGFD